MRTDQEIIEHARAVLQRNAANAPADRRAEILPGRKFRAHRGGMVTLINRSLTRVTFRREGYSDICEISCREFDRKFTEVKS
ncbi:MULTISPECIES: DUF4222 domain-containing protein [Lelliottia]|uniref:DUF4222 domain-containing protein n=1 Tax=Lelliottia aquatilis TaxID=2080838 RepID=A0ABX5A3H6_9ENTR|nr:MULTISPECIES: DUF4222 domain-containing protein [Lelliottia]POZ14090.1 hypothetical protein C3Z09_20145 [Lelliottia aquatilis]POZ23992.1 hypothetical protein C3712_07150 [Lelliottia aquatilis]POZ27606.1 hypothetical protein C3708_08505 [Lelliottia sp. 7254-16]POZ29875.1 hypothetical protein C3711_01715 [Lelliottia aquatilis]POZ35440.1 hypothetical protein C3710_01715 [Lelliottia aquatilis]